MKTQHDYIYNTVEQAATLFSLPSSTYLGVMAILYCGSITNGVKEDVSVVSTSHTRLARAS